MAVWTRALPSIQGISVLVSRGTTQSEIYPEDLLVERHNIEVRAGAFWQYFPLSIASAMFDEPLLLRGDEGTEVAYQLPNGLLAFVVADGSGTLLAETPDARNIPWFSEHFKNGFRGVTDEVRPVVLPITLAFPDPEFVTAIENVYSLPNEFFAVLADDTVSYLDSLAGLGLSGEGTDPVFQVAQEFAQSLNSKDVAGALGVSENLLLANIALLEPFLQILREPTASVDREDFAEVFLASLCIMQTFAANPPRRAECDEASD